jgi:hypothetical protein
MVYDQEPDDLKSEIRIRTEIEKHWYKGDQFLVTGKDFV